jgi:hypothetical protein
MSSGYEYIISKQVQWAKNHNIPLIGSEGKRGRPTYTIKLDHNLYEPLLEENETQFSEADGHEVNSSQGNPAKMQALHSSSALAVNIFQYWQKRGLISEIASACGFCNRRSQVSERIIFEEKYTIDTRFVIPPNIDVVIHNRNSSKYELFAVECKFSEAYGGRRHGGLKSPYLADQNIWADLCSLKKLAEEISPNDERYSYLHAAQLIKHILGLKAKLGNKNFRLLYLWYDVLGREGVDHRAEVEDFTEIAKSDAIKFHSMTYQELIVILERYYRDEHSDYIKYITERYN